MYKYTKLVPNDMCVIKKLSCQISDLLNLSSGEFSSSTLQPEVLSPTLPFSIPDGTYNSYSIVTLGLVNINSIPVPAGFSMNVSGNKDSDFVNGVTISDNSGGSVIITLLTKI